MNPTRTTTANRPHTASHTRRASLPTERRPATSCAEPGTRRVIIRSVMARRKRMRDSATSRELPYCAVRGAAALDPEEGTGGMPGLSGAAALEKTVQYHQSHQSHGSRRAGVAGEGLVPR